MSSFNELTNNCMKLAYSYSVNLSDEIYKATATDLKKLWPEYGYANVLGALAKANGAFFKPSPSNFVMLLLQSQKAMQDSIRCVQVCSPKWFGYKCSI